jgi:hypothetical protein
VLLINVLVNKSGVRISARLTQAERLKKRDSLAPEGLGALMDEREKHAGDINEDLVLLFSSSVCRLPTTRNHREGGQQATTGAA